MTELNEKVEALLQFEPHSRYDKEFLEASLLEELEIAAREQRTRDAIRLRRRLAELRGVKLPPEKPQTQEQRKLEEQIEKAEREGRWHDALILKRRRAGL